MRRLVLLSFVVSVLYLGWTGTNQAEDAAKATLGKTVKSRGGEEKRATASSDSTSPCASVRELGVGDTAPKLAVQEFVKGEVVKKFEKGKVYVVEFWATWCGPCKQTIPHLTALQKKYKDVTLIGVSVFEQQPGKVEPFVKEMGAKMNYRVATDAVPEGKESNEGTMAKNWMVAAGQDGIPTAFIVNGDGKIAWIGDPREMDELLDKIRAGKWDLKAAATEFAEARKEKARRAAEAAKAEEERVRRLTAKLPEPERAAVKAIEKLGGKVSLGDEVVTSVDFGGTKVMDAGLKEIKELKGLRELGLVGCAQVTDAGLKELQGLTKLQTLFIGGTGVTDAGLKHLQGLKELQRLGLSRTRVTDAGLKELKGLKGLRQLILIQTKVTAAGVADLEKALPELQIVTGDSVGRPAKKQRDLYLLGIGQQDDWDFLPLGFESAFREQGKAFYGHMHSRILLGREATRKEFMDGLAWLRRHATADDLVLIFIACHGNCVAGESVFSTRDGVVRPRDVKKELAHLPCHAIVVNDACQSGNWPRERPDDPMPPNVTALCCCLSTQNSSFEFDITLFEALYGRADFNKDGIVDLDEVIRYCGLRIKEVQGGRLTPVLHKAKNLKAALPLTKTAPNLVGVVHQGEVWSALLGRQDGDRYRVRIIGSPTHPGAPFQTHGGTPVYR
jgi:thiol-disulfide isomerase/thioredoxin